MNEPPKQRWGCLQWGIVVVVATLLLSWLWALSIRVHYDTRQMGGVNNCKQIILALKMYAASNGSAYPDMETADFRPTTANQVFRRLIQDEIASDERIFGCEGSKFIPDGKIGGAPGFSDAVGPGECHWMMLKGQSDTSIGKTPIIFENALVATWPPKWDMAAEGKQVRGRVWKGGQIIVGRNDCSVMVEMLKTDGMLDRRSKSNLTWDGKSWLDWLSKDQSGSLSLWDIEEK